MSENFRCTLTNKQRTDLDAANRRSDWVRLEALGCEMNIDNGAYELWELTWRGYTSGSNERVLMWSSG